MILRQVLIRHLRFEERDLQIAHLVPVDDLGVHVETKPLGDALDIVVRDLEVPARVAHIAQGIETHKLLGDIAQV